MAGGGSVANRVTTGCEHQQFWKHTQSIPRALALILQMFCRIVASGGRMQNLRLAFHTLPANDGLRKNTLKLTAFAAGVACALTLVLASTATADDTIRIWRIGSPHTGDKPSST